MSELDDAIAAVALAEDECERAGVDRRKANEVESAAVTRVCQARAKVRGLLEAAVADHRVTPVRTERLLPTQGLIESV